MLNSKNNFARQPRTSNLKPRTCFFVPTLLIIILPFPSALFSQNLVANPSFECGTDQCDFTTYYTKDAFGACNWRIPTFGTTDVFSTMLNNKNCWSSMPYVEGNPRYPDGPPIGTQLPRTGNRFIGLFTFYENPKREADPQDTVYREYAQTQLTAPLIPGEYYCAEMYVSLAETPRYATNNLGMYFHDDQILQLGGWIHVTPQVLEEEIITESRFWVKVDGAFQATTPARYLTIGNFLSYHDTKFAETPGDRPVWNAAYYFVDDVSVSKLAPKTFVYSGATTICEGELAHVNISGGLEKITWSTLSDTLTQVGGGINFQARPVATTSYLIKGSNCGTIVKDTLTIAVKPAKPVYLGNDQIICAGTSLKLDAGAGYASYQWQDESTDRFLDVTEGGTYTVIAEQENGCRFTDDIRITLSDIPTINLGNDTLVCDKPFPLKLSYSSESTYQWSNGSTSHEMTPKTSGTYSVIQKNYCGEASDTITIYSPDDIYIPNVVTVNNDNRNDSFVILGKGLGMELRIYNRWGIEILDVKDYADNWPAANDDIPTGIYYYQMAYPGCRTFNGWLQVIGKN